MLTLTIVLDETGKKISAHAVKSNETPGEVNVARRIVQGLTQLPASDDFDADLTPQPAETMDIAELLREMAAASAE